MDIIKKFINRNPTISILTLGYFIFILLVNLGIFLKIFYIKILFFIWPYPLILALEPWGVPSTPGVIYLIEFIGLGLIMLFGYFIQKIFGIPKNRIWYYLFFFLGIIILVILEVLIWFLVGNVWGFNIGE